jgi:uncharacterized membrane protein YphA (DoxX/SURF4 family)
VTTQYAAAAERRLTLLASVNGVIMSATPTIGRVMFAFVFLASAMEKWNDLRAGADAEVLRAVSPAIRIAKATVAENVGFNLCAMLPNDEFLVKCATLIEGLGAALFACGFALGAKLLILFTCAVTPVMHPFWRHLDEASLGNDAVLGVEMIMFFKNVALVGALVYYLGMRNELSEARERVKKLKTN